MTGVCKMLVIPLHFTLHDGLLCRARWSAGQTAVLVGGVLRRWTEKLSL